MRHKLQYARLMSRLAKYVSIAEFVSSPKNWYTDCAGAFSCGDVSGPSRLGGFFFFFWIAKIPMPGADGVEQGCPERGRVCKGPRANVCPNPEDKYDSSP